MKSQNQNLGIVTVIIILYNSSVNMKVIFNNLYFRYNTGYYFVCFCFARENSPTTNNSETHAGILLFLPCEYLVKADWPLLILQPMRLLAQYLNNMFSAEFLWNLLAPPPLRDLCTEPLLKKKLKKIFIKCFAFSQETLWSLAKHLHSLTKPVEFRQTLLFIIQLTLFIKHLTWLNEDDKKDQINLVNK